MRSPPLSLSDDDDRGLKDSSGKNRESTAQEMQRKGIDDEDACNVLPDDEAKGMDRKSSHVCVREEEMQV